LLIGSTTRVLPFARVARIREDDKILMKTIQLQVIKCTGLSAIRGNMFRKKILPLYFETRWGIHTFFVREPIDVLILDEENRVQVIKKDLKPWRLFFWNPRYGKVVELPMSNKNFGIGIKVELL
jgi:uncharacterized membrane protein (UPF0127 family)